jgi:hypothetical protein
VQQCEQHSQAPCTSHLSLQQPSARGSEIPMAPSFLLRGIINRSPKTSGRSQFVEHLSELGSLWQNDGVIIHSNVAITALDVDVSKYPLSVCHICGNDCVLARFL